VEFPRVGNQSDLRTSRRNVDVMPDGEHVLGVVTVRDGDAKAAPPSQITVVLNWFEEIKARLPAK
jgi:hypothetical protein